MSGYSDYIVPLIILAVIVAGIIKKTDIFDAFVEGAAEGLKTTSAILPLAHLPYDLHRNVQSIGRNGTACTACKPDNVIFRLS